MTGITARDKRFQVLADDVGEDLALFYFCAVFNVKYSNKVQFDTFEEYYAKQCDKLFLDGETNIKNILKENMTDAERWKATWGTGGKTNPYTEEDYKRLDELFDTYADRQLKSGGMDVQAEYVLRATCQDQLFAERCRERGGKDDISMYTQINKTIQDRLAAEQLRKKDAKPVEELKMDSIVDALQQAALARRGKLKSCEEVQEELILRMRKMGLGESEKYPYTVDAADQMIHMIQNTMYSNDNIPETAEMSEDLKFDENVVCEFAEEPNQEEKEIYQQLGLVRERK